MSISSPKGKDKRAVGTDILSSMQKQYIPIKSSQKSKVESTTKTRNNLQLAPLSIVPKRNQYDKSPGTANTHGGAQRLNYKQNMYELPS